jgi:hypothetical protein
MGLVARHRRFWIVIMVALLAVPMLVQAARQPQAVSEDEARVLSAAPAFPQSFATWLGWPRAVDRYLGDHFGLRDEMVRVHGIVRYAIGVSMQSRVLLGALSTQPLVILGRDRQLFYKPDIEQANGRIMRSADIATFADRAAELQAQLRAINPRFVVAMPPNAATILRDRLPPWAADKPAISEYDAMMVALAQRGVTAVDLRPALLAADSISSLYRRTDTHWNRLGSLIAYNALVNALGRQEWTIDPRRVFRGFEPVPSGDLARMLAISAVLTDEDARIDLSADAPAPLKVLYIDTTYGGYVIETGRAGPTMAVIGDSFTQEWPRFFAVHSGRSLWIHHEFACRFRRAVLDRYRPDIVVLAPTERHMFCHN